MLMPQDVYDTYCAVVAKFPHTGDETERRTANKKAVQTVRKKHGDRWITKTEHSNGWDSAAKDAMAYLHESEPEPIEGQKQKMYIWDMINGTTRQPNGRGESEAARLAYSLVPEPQDWLAGAEPEPGPEPGPDPDPDPDPAPDTGLKELFLVVMGHLQSLEALVQAQTAAMEALQKGQVEQTEALKAAIKELQVQVAKGVKIRF